MCPIHFRASLIQWFMLDDLDPHSLRPIFPTELLKKSEGRLRKEKKGIIWILSSQFLGIGMRLKQQ